MTDTPPTVTPAAPPAWTPGPGQRATRHPLSIAPMMDRTDRHFRLLARALSRRVLLYSEMIHANAVLRGDRSQLLGHAPQEGPLVLQLGGDDPTTLAEAAKIAVDWGYDEVNLNCGCPSERVQAGSFGVVLMGRPDQVARCVEAMRQAVSIPISVKHRIGFDELDSYAHMLAFVDTVAAAGCDRFTVHARKAWTQGLSPKANRDVPPLRHDEVWRLKAERPGLLIETNGGVLDLATVRSHLSRVDGVMVGRAAWDDPWMLATVDTALYGEAENPARTRVEAARSLLPIIEARLAAGDRIGPIVRPLLNLFAGVHGGRRFRRVLAEGHHLPGADARLLERALDEVQEVGDAVA